MKKTITITDDMYTPLILSLLARKELTEKFREFAADHGKKDMAQMYKKEIRTIDQMVEVIRWTEWR